MAGKELTNRGILNKGKVIGAGIPPSFFRFLPSIFYLLQIPRILHRST